MSIAWPDRVAILSIAAIVLIAVGAVDRWAPAPSADVGRGSEEAFSSDLFPRELPPRQKPIRWMAPRARFRFRYLPNGPATVEVAVVEPAAPVAVAADDVVLGFLTPGTGTASFPVRVRRGELEVEIRSRVFRARDGRQLGERLGHVRLDQARRLLPSAWLGLAFLVPALAVFSVLRICGARSAPATAMTIGMLLIEIAALLPNGLIRSPYTEQLGLMLAAGAVAVAVFALGMGRPRAYAGAAALLMAFVIQAVLGAAPMMVVSDAVFHAHKLAVVAHGNLFPTSYTQHARPFRIPYGVSFYALLAPIYGLGLDPVKLVRYAAGIAGTLAAGALFALVAGFRSAGRAALAVVLLQLQPAVFDILSYGNLSNAFGQAVSLGFFAWWAGSTPGGTLVGVVLAALAGTAHLSSFLVLVAMVLGLTLFRGPRLGNDRRRLTAALLGIGVAVAYYASFTGLIVEQLPRLLEGGGQGRGAAQGLIGALRLQLTNLLGWGVPVLLLAIMGAPRSKRSPFERDLTGYAFGIGLLIIPALLTPLDVRFLYALTPVVAVAAADGWAWLHDRGGFGKIAAWGLLGAQACIAASNLAEAIWSRYR